MMFLTHTKNYAIKNFVSCVIMMYHNKEILYVAFTVTMQILMYYIYLCYMYR